MWVHGHSRLAAHAPIGLHHRPRAGPTPSARAESDRVACLCPSATVPICNPRTSRAARPDVASASRRSSLGQQTRKDLAAFGLDQRVVIQRSSRIDVLRCGHDVEITGQHHGGAARHDFGGMGNEALKSGQLVAGLVIFRICRQVGRRSAQEGGFARESPRRSRNAPLSRQLRTRHEGRDSHQVPLCLCTRGIQRSSSIRGYCRRATKQVG